MRNDEGTEEMLARLTGRGWVLRVLLSKSLAWVMVSKVQVMVKRMAGIMILLTVWKGSSVLF